MNYNAISNLFIRLENMGLVTLAGYNPYYGGEIKYVPLKAFTFAFTTECSMVASYYGCYQKAAWTHAYSTTIYPGTSYSVFSFIVYELQRKAVSSALSALCL